MKYKSTRDSSEQEYTFEQALFAGYANDGGLFVPCSLPSIAAEELSAWSKLTFPELACTLLVSGERRHMNDFPTALALGIRFRSRTLLQ